MSSSFKVRYLLASLVLWAGLTACRTSTRVQAETTAVLSCEVQVLKLDNGFGYEVLQEGKVLIRQTAAPALPGVVIIPSAAKARKLGRIVCENWAQASGRHR